MKSAFSERIALCVAALGLVLVALLATHPQSVRASTRLDELALELRTTTDPDSIRFLMAQEQNRLGTIEGRRLCLETLSSIRGRYLNTPEFHKERARAYYEGQRFWDAYLALMEALRLDPADAGARIHAVEILYDRMFHRQDLGDLDRVLELLGENIRLLQERLEIPADLESSPIFTEHDADTRLYHRTILLQSLSLYESQRQTRRPAKRLECLHAGLRWAEHLQTMFPRDRHPDPWLLAGLHQMEMGELEAAEVSFLEAIGRMPARHREYYYVPPQLADSDAFLSATDKATQVERYWNRYADPFTGVNEMQLHYWKNCTLADLHYRDPRSPDVHGVETAIGQSIILVGLPGASAFDAGGWIESDASGLPHDFTRFRYHQRALQVEGSLLVTRYPEFDLQFEWMQGYGWQASTATAQFLGQLQAPGRAPVTYVRPPGAAARVYLSAASRRSSSADTREAIFVAAPAWGADDDWWKGARIDLEIVDRQTGQVREWITSPEGNAVHQLAQSTELLVLGHEMDIPPGEYLVIARVGSARSAIETIQQRITVEPFTGPSLKVSDLELAFPGTYADAPILQDPVRHYLPNPSATVGEVGKFEVGYSVYNLRRDSDGAGHYYARYAILPHDYRLAWTRKLRNEGASEEEVERFAKEGHTLGGVVLGLENFREVNFPVTDVPLTNSNQEFRAHAVVDASGLPPGRYVLRVEVHDLSTKATAGSELGFSKVDDEVLRQILMARR